MAQFYRGVNISGAEFGMSHLPGVYNTDYTYQSEATFRYFAARNLCLIRFPLQWERIQPVPSEPLDPQNLSLLKTAVHWARAHGCLMVLDIHNFARYSFNENGRLNAYVLDQLYNGVVRISRDDLADLWVRLSREFCGDPTVYAYDLMNEPHDIAGWKQISQHVLNAIRANGDNKLVMIPGDGWSSANRWPAVHGPSGWITDPARNFLYEAHLYFDFDESGTYSRTYDAELRANPALPMIGATRVARFIDWCSANRARGFLGEYGVPDSDPRWRGVLHEFLQALDNAGIGGAYWAAGEWWGSYALSVQPTNGFVVDRPQMATLLAHLPPGSFTSLSAAGNAGAVFAPGSILSGYAMGLSDATVEITDSNGTVMAALVLFTSPRQVNYLVPPEAALGRATVEAKSAGVVVGRGAYTLERVAPTLFSMNGEARGPATALVQRLKEDGTQSFEYAAASPIAFGDPSERLFLLLFGTGFRNPGDASRATVFVGPAALPVLYAGAQAETPGLDQVNAELPRSLADAGQAVVTFQVDGKFANPVTVTFRQGVQP